MPAKGTNQSPLIIDKNAFVSEGTYYCFAPCPQYGTKNAALKSGALVIRRLP